MEPERRQEASAGTVEPAEVARRMDEFQAAARRAGLKLTHQRLEVFRAVAGSVDHPSAEAVHRAVKATTPTVSLDTVYRTLWLLTDLGLITTLGPRPEPVRFDANLGQHHHYVCVECGLVRDFDSADLDGLPIPQAVNRFGKVVSARVEVRGICEQCAKLDENEPTLARVAPRVVDEEQNRSNSRSKR